MKRPRIILGIAAIAVLSTSVPVIGANEVELTQDAIDELPITFWPEERRPRMNGNRVEYQEDGPIEKRIRIDSGDLSFVFEDNNRWRFSTTTTPRYSILLQDSEDPSLTFGIARFATDEFIESLDEEEWKPYMRAILSDVIPKEITYQHYTGNRRSAPYVLKTWTRKVEYEYPMGESVVGKTREIFSFIDGDLFVFIFSGNKDKIDALRNDHNLFLTRMNLAKES